jgi:hypothetical protein
MQVKPRTPGSGLTVFGTTLTRRQTVVAGAVLLALVLLLVIVVPKAFGDDKKDDTTKAGAGPAASARANPTTAPAAVQPTAPSVPASTAPASSAPPSSGAAVALPAGWYLYKDKTGFSVPVPKGWSISHQGSEVYFREQGGQYRLLIVDQTDTPALNPVKDWESKESDRRGSYRNYHKIGIRPVSFWDNAADWEYTYDSDRGNPLHVVKRGFVTAKDQAYGITWSTSAGDWAANQANLNMIYQGFIPAKS